MFAFHRLNAVRLRIDEEIDRELGRAQPSALRLLRLRSLRLSLGSHLARRLARRLQARPVFNPI